MRKTSTTVSNDRRVIHLTVVYSLNGPLLDDWKHETQTQRCRWRTATTFHPKMNTFMGCISSFGGSGCLTLLRAEFCGPKSAGRVCVLVVVW